VETVGAFRFDRLPERCGFVELGLRRVGEPQDLGVLRAKLVLQSGVRTGL
jgi:hypothetical protein